MAVQKRTWFSKIDSREDALKTIKDSSKGFFFVGGLQIVIGLFLAPALIWDGFLFIVLAGILLKWHSRIAAVCLLIISLGSLATTILGRIGVIEGGRNVILAIIILVASIKAVEAAFKINGKFAGQNLGTPLDTPR